MTSRSNEIARYAANGVVATAVHYSVLFLNLEILSIRSAAFANLVASTAGIAVSFLGNRYFVFASTSEPIVYQAARFGGLYAMVAFVHASVLLVATDWLGFYYGSGFLIAVCIQTFLGFWGSKRYVFNRPLLIRSD